MANIYEMLMDTDKAIELHKERYKIAADLEDLHGQGKACVSLGAMYLIKEDLDQSLFYYGELLNILRSKLRKCLLFLYLCKGNYYTRYLYSSTISCALRFSRNWLRSTLNVLQKFS